MEIAFSILLTVYLVFLVLVVVVWQRLPVDTKSIDPQELPGVSIVIPVRNEQKNIPRLMDSLSALSYPRDRFEIIIVDDDSQDDTVLILEQYIARFDNLKCIRLQDPPGFQGSFKKRALTKGIEAAVFPVIVTSDADCQYQPGWIYQLARAMKSRDSMMLSGPVIYHSGEGFSMMLNIELSCLVAVGAVSMHLGRPNMCNGANLAFRKEAFMQVEGYRDFQHIASGDDEFLLYKVFQKFPNQVGFLKDTDAVVTTDPPQSWRQLLNQRIRWGGKWKEHRSFVTRMLALFVFSFHLIFCAVLVLTLSGVYSWQLLLVQWLLKTSIEYFLVRTLLNFYNRSLPVKWFLLMQTLYSIYVVLVGIIAQVKGFNWKNRQYHE